VISLEIDLHHAKVARRNVERAALSDRVEIVGTKSWRRGDPSAVVGA